MSQSRCYVEAVFLRNLGKLTFNHFHKENDSSRIALLAICLPRSRIKSYAAMGDFIYRGMYPI